jgi:hypothetical protein
MWQEALVVCLRCEVLKNARKLARRYAHGNRVGYLLNVAVAVPLRYKIPTELTIRHKGESGHSRPQHSMEVSSLFTFYTLHCRLDGQQRRLSCSGSLP